MNEFTAKKLGEVLAFTDVGLETFNKSKNAFESVLGGERFSACVTSLLSQKDLIHAIADRAQVLETVLTKLEKTGDKLRSMRDLYIGDEWDNATELMEWSGFFEGAAVVHAAILLGASEEMGHSELKSLAEQALNLHKELLEEAREQLYLTGRKKASSV